MSSGTFLSWDEMHHLALPPHAAMLIPPTPDPAELEAINSGAPEQRPDWLNDAYHMDQNAGTIDLDANRAAAERAEYGDPAIRLLAHMVTVNALLECAQAPVEQSAEDENHDPKEPKRAPQ